MRKFFFIIIIILSTQNITGQCKLTIIQEGKKCELMNEVVILNHQDIQPTRLNDSTIQFTLNITQPDYLYILLDPVKHADTSMNYNWKARMWIDPEIDQRKLVVNYSTKIVTIKNIVSLNKNINKPLNNLQEWDSITKLSDKLFYAGKEAEEQSMETQYIERHPDSYFSLWLFTHSRLYKIDANKKLALFDKLNPALQKYPEYHQIKTDLSGARKYPNPGDTFEEFLLTDVHGKVFKSTSIKNKWILLHFWSNSCGPCVKEMDSMVSYYKTLDTSRIAFISVALDNSEENWQKATTTHKIIWTNLWEPDNFYGTLCLNYNVYSMPFFILFNNEKKTSCNSRWSRCT